MSDKLVFDLAQEIEGSPNVFVRKDWINILDNQNQNYNNNQSVLDTSQLSNSNKYMSYREAYLSVPFLVTLASIGVPTNTGNLNGSVKPASLYFRPADYTPSRAIGLKNWFGQIIHSFTLDYNGTTVIQQTPYINFWNSFKLVTSLSLNDIRTQGATIGFYPDDALSFQYYNAGLQGNLTQGTVNGYGTMNNTILQQFPFIPAGLQVDPMQYDINVGNDAIEKRCRLINFDVDGFTCNTAYPLDGSAGLAAVTYSALLYSTSQTPNPLTTGGQPAGGALQQVWKSYVSNKINAAYDNGTINGAGNGCMQYSIVATIYLKHIHSFFNMCPLLKGVFMKMTMNLNNTSTNFSTSSAFTASLNSAVTPSFMTVQSVSNPQGGVNPLMINSARNLDYPDGAVPYSSGSLALYPFGTLAGTPTVAGVFTQNYIMNISVGSTCLNSTLASLGSGTVSTGQLSKSIYLYIPAYTFNPVFEQAYLSNPVKQIKYTDVYQYQVLNVQAGANFNNLLTNGIANIKSVLILPFYSASAGTNNTNTLMNISINNNTGFNAGVPVWQSPFDTAGTGTTSPLCPISNFNVQVSGQNAIYNVERYNFEQFNNQLYGQNAVNGGLTDGITSCLIDRQDFDMSYCYYYVNIERMLPVEETVPKSIQILGQNYSSKALDLYCFIEYGNQISIDCLTGARV